MAKSANTSALVPIPIGYDRLNAVPLDGSSIFSTYAALTAYAATGPTAYYGQICVDTQEGKAYVIKSDGTLSNITDLDGGTM
jgi:hypothetical protein